MTEEKDLKREVKEFRKELEIKEKIPLKLGKNTKVNKHNKIYLKRNRIWKRGSFLDNRILKDC